ncbi:MAG: response regulator transcription factor [Xylophilus ampelinus]
MRILLVEDDKSLGSTIRTWLQMDGYAVDWLERGDQVDPALKTFDYQGLILDRGLPGLDGDDVLRSLRARNDFVPVLVITARDALHERIKGLNLGADDYLVKPFDLEELSARLRAALRRGAIAAPVLLKHGRVELDPATKRVAIDGQSISVTSREFALLQTLMRRNQQVFSRAQLEESLYGWGSEVDSNAVEVHISNLRRKFGAGFIKTVRNQGYGLAPP